MPQDADIATPLETEMFTLPSGLALRRVVLGPRDAKATMLLLHGYPETVQVWYRLAPLLARDVAVHAFDWPGYGGSTRPRDADFGYRARAYARVLDEYIAAAGIDRASLLVYGTDIGGLPALLLATEQPGSMARLVVSDFAPLNRPAHMMPMLRALKSAESGSPIRDQINQSPPDMVRRAVRDGWSQPMEGLAPVPAFVFDDLTAHWSANATTVADSFFAYYTRFSADQEHFEAIAAQLTVPTLVLWGANDRYIVPAMGQDLAALIDAELSVLPAVGHYAHLEAPHAVADAIAGFAGPSR